MFIESASYHQQESNNTMIGRFAENMFVRTGIAMFALGAWLLVFFPGLRQKTDVLLKSLIDEALGKGEAEAVLYRTGPSWAQGEPTLAFWRLAVWFEFFMMMLAAVGWVILFKLFGLSGPVWLTSFTPLSVLAVNVVGTILYSLAMAVTITGDRDSKEQ